MVHLTPFFVKLSKGFSADKNCLHFVIYEIRVFCKMVQSMRCLGCTFRHHSSIGWFRQYVSRLSLFIQEWLMETLCSWSIRPLLRYMPQDVTRKTLLYFIYAFLKKKASSFHFSNLKKIQCFLVICMSLGTSSKDFL